MSTITFLSASMAGGIFLGGTAKLNKLFCAVLKSTRETAIPTPSVCWSKDPQEENNPTYSNSLS